jgi:hypothetical protein
MTRYIPLLLLTLSSCEPELVRYCHYVCTDTNVETSADVCGGDRENPDCEQPTKRFPVLGEEVRVVGLDPDEIREDDYSSVQLLGYIEETIGAQFYLSVETRQGFLGGAVYGQDNALIGIVQGERDGRMWGRVVE